MEENLLQPNCAHNRLSATEININSDHKVKVRDFAYPSSFSPSSPPLHLPPVPEIFNQYEGLAEVEYRWTHSPRMYPIPGKTLSRLLELGWITQEDILARASPMDLEELRRYNARSPTYPWKPLHWTTIPDIDTRLELMLKKSAHFLQRDTTMANSELKEASRKVNRHKRQAKEDFEAHNGAKSKKRKFQVQSPQSKQYPAPLHAYDPVIYPEVTFPTVLPQAKPPQFKQYPAPLCTYDPATYPEAAFPTVSPAQAPSQFKEYPTPLHAYDPTIYPAATLPTVLPQAKPPQFKQYPTQLRAYDPATYPEAAFSTVSPARAPSQFKEYPALLHTYDPVIYPGVAFPTVSPPQAPPQLAPGHTY